MIELHQVSTGYSRPVAENIEACLKPGEICMIVGLNGAGKSTLLKTILGLLPALSGRITMNTLSISDLSSHQRAQKMAYVSQNRNIPDMTLGQLVLHGRFPYLKWPRRYSKADHQICQKAMKQLGLEHLQERKLASLSGGELQKAYLAMSLCQQTDYILLDEPGNHIDLPGQMELTRILHTLANAGKGVICIEHDLPHALQHADKLLVLHEHKQVFFGTPEEFLQTTLDEEVFGIRLKVLADHRQHYIVVEQNVPAELS